MFDFNAPELLIVGIVALLVIGPKELPRAMRVVGYWLGRARGAMRQFRSGFDAMVREAELAELEKQWKAENERIMREFPADAMALPGPEAGAAAPANVATDDPVMQRRQEPHAPAVAADGDGPPPVMVAQPRLFPDPDPDPNPDPAPAAEAQAAPAAPPDAEAPPPASGTGRA